MLIASLIRRLQKHVFILTTEAFLQCYNFLIFQKKIRSEKITIKRKFPVVAINNSVAEEIKKSAQKGQAGMTI